jgi:hypothetical protein
VERDEAAEEVPPGGGAQLVLARQRGADEGARGVNAMEDLPEEVLVTEHLRGGHGVLRRQR